MWTSSSIFSSISSSSQFLEFMILLRRHDSTFEIIFSWSEQCQTFIQNWKQYCETLTRYKFSLFVEELINIICLIIWIVTEWSVQIMMSAKDSFIIWQIFLIVQTKQTIFNFIDQYQISASIRNLLRKRMSYIFCQFSFTVWSSRSSWLFCMW